jgi:hypothetical protein
MLSTCKVLTYSAFSVLGEALLLRARHLSLECGVERAMDPKIRTCTWMAARFAWEFLSLAQLPCWAFIQRMAQFRVLILHRIDWWFSHVGPDLAIDLSYGPCFGNAPTLGLYLYTKSFACRGWHCTWKVFLFGGALHERCLFFFWNCKLAI